jgi:hypothetical protein
MRCLPECRSVYIFHFFRSCYINRLCIVRNNPIDGSYPLAGFPLLLTYLWFSRDLTILALPACDVTTPKSGGRRKHSCQVFMSTPHVKGCKCSQKICGNGIALANKKYNCQRAWSAVYCQPVLFRIGRR